MKFKKKVTPNKKVRNATVLEYYGITFKSKLELYCYKRLKEYNLRFQYEKIKYELMSPFDFENDSYELFKKKGERTFSKQRPSIRSITYTPDFVGYYPSVKGKMFIIETKGNPNEAFPIKWKMFKRHIQINDLDIDLYMPRNQKQVDEAVNLIINKFK